MSKTAMSQSPKSKSRNTSLKSIVLGAVLLACLSLGTFFFLPPADNASAQEHWRDANFQTCIYDNLNKLYSDRAATLLEEYCRAVHASNSRRR